MSPIVETVLVTVTPAVVLWALARVDQIIATHVHNARARAALFALDDAVSVGVRAADQVLVDALKDNAGGRSLTVSEADSAMERCLQSTLDVLGDQAQSVSNVLGGPERLQAAIRTRAEATLRSRRRVPRETPRAKSPP